MLQRLLAATYVDVSSLPHATADNGKLDIILATIFGLFGTIAVLVIVIAGFRYIISRGEAREMAQAKNMIIYALVGLGVTILAYSIVIFVINNV